jgi:hypothetical protein
LDFGFFSGGAFACGWEDGGFDELRDVLLNRAWNSSILEQFTKRDIRLAQVVPSDSLLATWPGKKQENVRLPVESVGV